MSFVGTQVLQSLFGPANFTIGADAAMAPFRSSLSN